MYAIRGDLKGRGPQANFTMAEIFTFNFQEIVDYMMEEDSGFNRVPDVEDEIPKDDIEEEMDLHCEEYMPTEDEFDRQDSGSKIINVCEVCLEAFEADREDDTRCLECWEHVKCPGCSDWISGVEQEVCDECNEVFVTINNTEF